jgi:hypothetical protein
MQYIINRINYRLSLSPDVSLISKAALISCSETATELLLKYARVKLPFVNETSKLMLFSTNNFILIVSCICIFEQGETFPAIIYLKYNSCINIFSFPLISTDRSHVTNHYHNLMTDIIFRYVKFS